MLEKDQALCIRKVDYSETSQVVTFFTRGHGKLPAMAKGARRKKSAYDGPFELFTFGDIVFSRRETANLANVTEFNQIPRFPGLRIHLHGLHAAMFAAELLEKFTEDHDAHPRLFEGMLLFLDQVQQASDPSAALGHLIGIELRILEQSGHLPLFKQCANCSRPFEIQKWKTAWFSASVPGLICPDCESAFPDKISIPADAADLLARPGRIKDATAENRKQAQKALVNYLTYLLGRPPKMAGYFQ